MPPMHFDFKHLEVANKTSWMDLPEIGPSARVCLAPASEENAPYFNALLKAHGKQRPKRRSQVTAQDLAENREADKALYAAHVVKGWEAIPGPGGVMVPFKQELAAEFLDSIPAWMFDRMRLHASDHGNYMDGEVPDAQELAGNSESGSSSS